MERRTLRERCEAVLADTRKRGQHLIWKDDMTGAGAFVGDACEIAIALLDVLDESEADPSKKAPS